MLTLVPVYYLYMCAVCLDVLNDGYVKVTMQHVHLLFDLWVCGRWSHYIAAMRGKKLVCCAARMPDLHVSNIFIFPVH